MTFLFCTTCVNIPFETNLSNKLQKLKFLTDLTWFRNLTDGCLSQFYNIQNLLLQIYNINGC